MAAHTVHIDCISVIKDNYHMLVRSIHPSRIFINQLRISKNTKHIASGLEEITDPNEQVSELLVRLCLDEKTESGTDSAFETFKEALQQCGQSHVVDVLNGNNSTVMSTEHCELLTDTFSELCAFVDPDGGLVESLYSRHVLSRYDKQHVESMPDYTSKASTIITLLQRKPDSAFDIFIETLISTGQEHIVYILTGEGTPPLSRRSLETLTKHSLFLLDHLEPINTNLLAELVSRGVFRSRDDERVTAKRTTYKQCEELHRLICRKSENAFEEFIAALIKTGQLYVAIKLVGHEVNGEVRVSFSDENANLADIEKQMVVKMQDLVRQSGSTEATNKLLKALGCNGIHVSYVRSGSISIQFRCSDLESLASFRQLNESKELDCLFSEAFCPFFVVEGLTAICLDIKPEEFDRCSKVLLEQQIMSPFHRLLLNVASEHCLEKISVTEELLTMLSISKRQVQAIMAEKKPQDQVRMLLEAVSRRPDTAFQQFVDALVQTQQNDIVMFLSGGETPDVEANLGEEVRPVDISSDMLLLTEEVMDEEMMQIEQSQEQKLFELQNLKPFLNAMIPLSTSLQWRSVPVQGRGSEMVQIPSPYELIPLLNECKWQLVACQSYLRKLMRSQLFGTTLSEWMHQPPELVRQLKVLISLVSDLALNAAVEAGLKNEYTVTCAQNRRLSALIQEEQNNLIIKNKQLAHEEETLKMLNDKLVETIENSMATQEQLQTANQVLKTLEQKVEEGKEREQMLRMQCEQMAEMEKQLLEQLDKDQLRLSTLRAAAAERTENVSLLLQRLQVHDEVCDAEMVERLKVAAEQQLEQIQVEKEVNLRQGELLKQCSAREQDLEEQLKHARDNELRGKVLLEKAGAKENKLLQRLRDLQLVLLSCTVTVMDSGLVDRLCQDSVISEREWTLVTEHNCDPSDVMDNDRLITPVQINERFMDVISKKFPQELDVFLNVLDVSGQKQLADVIRGQPGAHLPFSQDPQLLHCCEAYNASEHDRMAVTYLNGKIYIACSPQSNSIAVFSSDYFSLVQKTVVVGLTTVYDIVACSETNRIYILDGDCVWSVDEGLQMPTRIELPSSLEANSLSVTSYRLLLVEKNRLLILKLNNITAPLKLKCVKLPLYMKAIHAVETKHRSFVVCHTSMLSDCADPVIFECINKLYNGDPINLRRERITEVDAAGRVLRFCGELLSNPTHLTLDPVGRVLVADGDRVLLLDSQLQLQRVLLSRTVVNRNRDKNNTDDDKMKEIMILPEQICYLPAQDRLMVANTTGVVTVHSFTPENCIL